MSNSPSSTSLSKYFAVTSLLGAGLLVVSFRLIRIPAYPNQRVCKWFEFFTDGWAPDFAAEDGRHVLSMLWRRIFEGGYVERSGLLEVVTRATRRRSPRGRANILELAAGTGVAAGLWHQALQGAGIISIQTVLTDLQPMVRSWEMVKEEYSTETTTDNPSTSSISYVNGSVDATNASEAVRKYFPDWNYQDNDDDNRVIEIRMIHLALHHFEPDGVKALFADAVQSNAMIVVGDLVPSLRNVFFQSQWGFHEFVRLIPRIVKDNPAKLLWAFLTPLVVFAAYHDAAVSVLRSYSFQQLQQFLDECTPNDNPYQIETFQMFTFADHLGLDKERYPLLDSPHVQFFVAVPN